MADFALIDEYIQALSPAWNDAVARFLDANRPDPIPADHPRKDILAVARAQLRRGMMLGDQIIFAYMSLLRDMPLSVSAAYMDTFALKTLRGGAGSGEPPMFSPILKPRVGRGHPQHIFRPVHHGYVKHWSLIHVDVRKRCITSYDSQNVIGGIYTRQAREEYWIEHKGLNAADKSAWTQPASQWDGHQHVQAAGSNGCGILLLLLMRLLCAFDELPQLLEGQASVETMRRISLRMRHRIAPELLADHVNPRNKDIPQ